MNNPTKLLTPAKIGDLSINNRVVMAPLTRGRAGSERIPNELMAEYYSQRASAGLIISEATVVSKQGIGWVDSPGIFSEQQCLGWKKVVESVHKKGGRIFLQLWHCGRASHSSFFSDGSFPVAPSAIAIKSEPRQTPNGKQDSEIPRALLTEEVKDVVQDYKQAAIYAKAAGFDGVEVHGANGYLIDQFLQSKTNHRTDEYGGSIGNRYRFLQEIVTTVSEIFPPNRIGVRLSPNGTFNDMGSKDFRETFLFVAKELNSIGLAYLHVMDGLAFGFHDLGKPMELKEFREVYDGIIMGNCGYTEKDAEEAVVSGMADLVAFGRPFITNPDLVERFANGWNIVPSDDSSKWYGGGAEGYTNYPSYQSDS